MGNVRSEKIKRIAHELLSKYPSKFTSDFEENKKTTSTLAAIPTTKLRNNIAGYITRLVAISKSEQSAETESE